MHFYRFNAYNKYIRIDRNTEGTWRVSVSDSYGSASYVLCRSEMETLRDLLLKKFPVENKEEE